MEQKIKSHSEKEQLGLKFTRDMEDKLQIFKVDNKITLPMNLEQSVIIELDLNEEESKKGTSKKTNNKSELFITIPLFCIMSMIILSCIGLVLYFYIKDFV